MDYRFITTILVLELLIMIFLCIKLVMNEGKVKWDWFNLILTVGIFSWYLGYVLKALAWVTY